MPHFRYEYSANLAGRLDIAGLCEATRQAALDTGLFEAGGIRVRAIRCDEYAIADAHPDNAFLHLSLRVGAGRPLEARKRAGEHVFAAVSAFCAELFESPHFAFSFDMSEIDPDLSWKKNTIHPRLKAGDRGK